MTVERCDDYRLSTLNPSLLLLSLLHWYAQPCGKSARAESGSTLGPRYHNVAFAAWKLSDRCREGCLKGWSGTWMKQICCEADVHRTVSKTHFTNSNRGRKCGLWATRTSVVTGPDQSCLQQSWIQDSFHGLVLFFYLLLCLTGGHLPVRKWVVTLYCPI